MSGQSNVGNSGVYEAGDQRNYKDSEIKQAQEEARFHEGKQNSHLAQDSKDERSIANKLEREAKREKEPENQLSEEDRASQLDSTLPAKLHGNEPSKGAKIDQQLKEEEDEELRRKGKK
ncbi:hypothetical protein P171DRAFT_425826 [Karstenula rhodostoma CBS 690.94]|uniref:Uncharacterized protein n=1 Tax=Karstenula rhodostoma CBS 690.94 TaxID=1392251 RepID=A0A9P4UI46_9PLEO|nr:hypothetical protein P171DRAFT_425826 [Karstenula rhodostoma CBS 690.94]